MGLCMLPRIQVISEWQPCHKCQFYEAQYTVFVVIGSQRTLFISVVIFEAVFLWHLATRLWSVSLSCIDELWIATTGAFHHCCFSMFGSLTGGIKGWFSLKLLSNNMYYRRLYTNKMDLAGIWCHYLWNCSIYHWNNWHFRHRLSVLCRFFFFCLMRIWKLAYQSANCHTFFSSCHIQMNLK